MFFFCYAILLNYIQIYESFFSGFLNAFFPESKVSNTAKERRREHPSQRKKNEQQQQPFQTNITAKTHKKRY